LRAVHLRLAPRPRETIRQERDVLALCLSPAVRRFERGQDARLEGGVSIRMLDQQEGGTRAVIADRRPIWPAVQFDHGLEPGRVR
jgi:hypothetical protein